MELVEALEGCFSFYFYVSKCRICLTRLVDLNGKCSHARMIVKKNLLVEVALHEAKRQLPPSF